jgi:hypothetical protein
MRREPREAFNPFPRADSKARGLAVLWSDYYALCAALQREGLHDHVGALGTVMRSWSRSANYSTVSSLVRGAVAWQPREPDLDVAQGLHAEEVRRESRVRRSWTQFLALVEAQHPEHLDDVLAARAAYRAARERIRHRRSGLTRRGR